MKRTIEYYNELVPLMNKLIKEGYDVDNYCSNSEGYGFYVNLDEKYYIQVFICNLADYADLYVELKRRGGVCYYDVIADVVASKYVVRESAEVEEPIRKLIAEHKTIVEGTPEENLKNKLTAWGCFTKQDVEDAMSQLDSLRTLIHEIKQGDLDVTGIPSELLVKDIIDYLTK